MREKWAVLTAHFYIYLNLEKQLEYVAHVVDKYATLTGEINKFRLKFHSVINEADSGYLSLTSGINYHQGRGIVNALATALNGIDKSVVHAHALEIIGVIAVEFRENVFGSENHSLDTVFFVHHAVCKSREVKLKKSRLELGVTSDDSVIFAVFNVNDEVTKGAHISPLTGLAGAPKLAVVSKADFNYLNKSGFKTVPVTLKTVNTANAPHLILLAIVSVVNVGVEQGEFVALVKFVSTKADGVGVGADLVGSVKIECCNAVCLAVFARLKIVQIENSAATVAVKTKNGISKDAILVIVLSLDNENARMEMLDYFYHNEFYQQL